MFSNPFSPIFGGKPGLFFGRADILARFNLAMADAGSEDRALFVTGTRGSGKTALLEQLSSRASSRGWRVLDLGPENTVASLVKYLAGRDSETRTVDPRVSISVLGSGGSIGGVSTSRTTTFSPDSLTELFLEACGQEGRGVLVTIDEVQKIDLSDMSAICNAYQMASRKGLNAMLAIAGLPSSHEDVTQHTGCTYMRRAAHVELGLLDRDEAQGAFLSALGMTCGISVDEQGLATLVQASMGHPYLIQLLGYHLVTVINEGVSSESHIATRDEIGVASTRALTAYELRALKPLVDELGTMERAYLSCMVTVMDKSHVAGTADVANVFTGSTSSLNRARESLVRSGIIISAGRGRVRFNIPYLRTYVQREPPEGRNAKLVEEWDV